MKVGDEMKIRYDLSTRNVIREAKILQAKEAGGILLIL